MSDLVPISITVNGRKYELEVEPRLLLVHLLREKLLLTGTHVGCDTSQCGACTVLLDGQPVSSCLLLATEVRGRPIETVEGLADRDRLHPIQEAFIAETAFQCSFCTPGMLLATKALLAENPDPTEEEIKDYLAGNLCRCGSYLKIIAAVRRASERLRAARR